MKVLVISHSYPDASDAIKGIFVHEQVKALIRNGVEIKVVSPKPWTPFPINHLTAKWRAYDAIPERADWEGIEVYYPRYLLFPRMWLFAASGKRMYRAIRKIIREIYDLWAFDLIHAHVILPGGCAAQLVGEEFGKPFVITIHGFQHPHEKKARYYQAYAVNKASRIMLVSSKLHRFTLNQFGHESKLTVISNGVDPKKLIDKGQFPQSAGTVTILSVSHLIPTKGIDINLRAIKLLLSKHNNIKYLIVGQGSQMSNLLKLVRELDLEEKVTFLGHLTHSEVMQQMALCDIFSLPSWMEGFGIVYLEAMAHGKPVIACRGEGIEDVIENGESGLLVEPKNIERLVEALDFLLSHPDKAKEIGQRARKHVLKGYTWDKNVEKTIEVYREVLNDKKSFK